MNANGGMSMANNFLVKFDVPGTGNLFAFLCDEAQLPNVNAATGTIKGRYMGEGQVNYPHTRVFTEMQLGFQCDASMTPLLFLNQWFGQIFPEYADGGDAGSGFYSPVDESPGSTPSDARTIMRPKNRTVQLNYPDTYCRNIYVTKTELGPRRDGSLRTSMTYMQLKLREKDTNYSLEYFLEKRQISFILQNICCVYQMVTGEQKQF